MILAIKTSGLTRCFGELRAVDGLDLRVEAGKFYGFLGPNGAGKSTTIKMLTGLLAPTCGTMCILGEEIKDPDKAREVKRRVGVVPEELALFDNLTAQEYLTFIGRMYKMPMPIIRERCRELLTMMNLDGEEKLTLEYSHGMKKKLTLAAALIPNPDLLFLDEPFEGVDAVASLARAERHIEALRPARCDRVPDIACSGYCRKALHRLRNYCRRQACASGHDGRDSRRWLAGGTVPRGRRQR